MTDNIVITDSNFGWKLNCLQRLSCINADVPQDVTVATET